MLWWCPGFPQTYIVFKRGWICMLMFLFFFGEIVDPTSQEQAELCTAGAVQQSHSARSIPSAAGTLREPSVGLVEEIVGLTCLCR